MPHAVDAKISNPCSVAFNLTRPDADPPDSHVLLPALLVQWLCCCKAAYLDMLEGAASIFEGIDGAPLRSIPPQRASGASGELAHCAALALITVSFPSKACNNTLSLPPTAFWLQDPNQHRR